VKELEVKLKEDETTKRAAEEDRKKKPGVKDTAEVTKLKKEMKTKTEELDKFKTQAKKVSTIKMLYGSGCARTVHMLHISQDIAILAVSLIN
jgi:predicted RNase H-like nuclease (RuvC/YqgF family)